MNLQSSSQDTLGDFVYHGFNFIHSLDRFLSYEVALLCALSLLIGTNVLKEPTKIYIFGPLN